MAAKTLTLGLAERVVINNLLATTRKGDLATARTVRDVRRSLKLQDAADAVEDLAEAAKASGRAVDYADLLKVVEVAEHEIDETPLRWLQDQLQAHDWSVARGQDGKDVEIAVPPALLEIVANTADALGDALAK